jgi:hypothetical protein
MLLHHHSYKKGRNGNEKATKMSEIGQNYHYKSNNDINNLDIRDLNIEINNRI